MKIRVTQPSFGDAIHSGSGYDAAEGAWCTETLVVRHDEQHVGRALRRHDARRPPRFRLRSLFPDLTTELRIGRRELLTAEARRRARRPRRAGDLLRQSDDGCHKNHRGANRQLLYTAFPRYRAVTFFLITCGLSFLIIWVTVCSSRLSSRCRFLMPASKVPS